MSISIPKCTIITFYKPLLYQNYKNNNPTKYPHITMLPLQRSILQLSLKTTPLYKFATASTTLNSAKKKTHYQIL